MSSAQCYYPNGDPSKENDVPCSNDSNGVACCPQGWSCQNNGLCYLQNQNYYGRYTCTDKTWQSSGCPNICTHDLTANGNEAILQCSQGSFCCDANRPELSDGQPCCDTTANRFSIVNLQQVNDTNAASPSSPNLASPSPTASVVTSNEATNIQKPSSMSPMTILFTSLEEAPSSHTGSASPSVVIITSIEFESNTAASATPTSISSSAAQVSTAASSTAQAGGGTSTGTIVGAAVGGVAALLIIILLILLLLRRKRRQRQTDHTFLPHASPLPMYPDFNSPTSPKPGHGSELAGSTPDLTAAAAEKRWYKDSPSTMGTSPDTSPTFGNHRQSGMTQISGIIPSPRAQAVELPAGADNTNSSRPLSELPARSRSEKDYGR